MPATETQKAVMTIYEKWALIISIIALVAPAIRYVFTRWVVRAKLNHYQTGYGYLFINQSGSYIRIQSVYEAVNKPISIKNITLSVVRERDNQQRNYTWVAFTSPTNMQFIGNNASAIETAHPFRIEADNVFCAFTEFGEMNQNAYRSLLPYYDALANWARALSDSGMDYDEARSSYISCNEYKTAAEMLEKELFWVIDKYRATITVAYRKRVKEFPLVFEVTNEQFTILKSNMKESLIIPLKDVYGVPRAMQAVQVPISSK